MLGQSGTQFGVDESTGERQQAAEDPVDGDGAELGVVARDNLRVEKMPAPMVMTTTMLTPSTRVSVLRRVGWEEVTSDP